MDDRVLDIDLDFFLSDVAHNVPAGSGRLPSDEYRPWSPTEVRHFMEGALGLSPERKLPAILCVGHDETLYHCEELIKDGRLGKPFELVHVDAHADMGLGDNGWVEVLRMAAAPDAVRAIVSSRHCERIGIGNYVTYMALFRMLRSVTYVHPDCEGWDRDVFERFLEDGGDRMRIPVWDVRDEVDFEIALQRLDWTQGCMYRPENQGEGSRREPGISFSIVSRGDYCDHAPFRIAFLAQSPEYTPLESDALIPVLGEYLDFAACEADLLGERFLDARDLLGELRLSG